MASNANRTPIFQRDVVLVIANTYNAGSTSMPTKTQSNKKTSSTNKPRREKKSKQPTEATQSNRRSASKPVSKSSTNETKATKARASSKAATKETAATKSRSGLDLAAEVLAQADQPLNAKAITERVIAAGWQTDGKTPWATLYASMTREIVKKGNASRFRKMDRGLFARATPKGSK